MSLSWIDQYVDGVIDYCNSNDIFEIYKALNIEIVKLDTNDEILQGNDALYMRNHFDIEIVFIRDNLPYKYEKFILAHELGHAILHIEINSAAHNELLNKGKLERQADYFGLKLIGIKLGCIEHSNLTIKQLAKTLYVTERSLISMI